MSKFKRFGEFVGKKRKDLIDAKDGLAGQDYEGPLETKPPQEPTKGKKNKPLPYKATGEEEKGIVWTAPDEGSKKPFGQEATPGITPETSPLGKKISDNSKQRPKPKKITTEQFIEKTKEMNDTEFLKFILESHDAEISTVTDLFGNEFTPDPQQTIEYISGLMLGNPHYMEKFLREMKRRGGLKDLMSELFQHGDSYDLMVDHLEDPEFGNARSSKLAKTMNDRYMKVFDNFDFGGDSGIEEQTAPPLDQGGGGDFSNLLKIPGKDTKSKGGATGGGFGDGSDADPNYKYGNSQYANNPDSNPMGSAGPGHGPKNNNPQVLPMGGAQNPNFGNGKVQPPIPPKKMKEGGEPRLKGDSNNAALRLINELSGYKHFKKHMIDRCMNKGCD